MPVGAAFNIAVFPASDTNTGAFRFAATPQPGSNLAQFSAALTDGQPNWIVLASQVAAQSSPVVLNLNPIGIQYLTTANQWAVFNEKSGSHDPHPRAMPTGAEFNVGIYQFGPGSLRGEWSLTAAANGNVQAIPIDIPLFNHRPDAILLVTPTIEYIGPGPYDRANPAVTYDSSLGMWTIVTESGAAFRAGAQFNVSGYVP